MNKDVAVIIPAFHAAAFLPAALASLDGQAHITEICVACHDAETRTVANTYTPTDPDVTYTVIDNPSGTTPDALNAALNATNAPYVARLDAHATFTPNYLSIARQVHDSATIANVGGIQKPVATTRFQRAVAAALASVAGSGGATYRTGRSATDTDTVYLGVFRRDALQEVGGFNPHCLRNQDAELNIRLRQAGHRVRFDPRLVATYTPRASVSQLARQYHDYGRWRRYTHKTTGEPFGLRQLLLPFLVGVLGASVIAAMIVHPVFLMPLGGYVGLLLAAGAHAAHASDQSRIGDMAHVAVALAVMHLSWGSGFMRGAPTKERP